MARRANLPPPRRPGVQSVERSIRLLKLIATRRQIGWPLADLAEHSAMAKGTVHRLLACLVRERLVRQRARDRHYLPGPLMFELGLALPSFLQFVSACEPSLKRLARKTGLVSYLLLRSGADFVCAARQGSSELKALSIEIGTRRPLLSAAGGIAMLVALPRREAAELIEENARELSRFGPTRVSAVKSVLRHSQERGYGLHRGEIVPGVHALGIAVSGAPGSPFAALSVVGAAEKLPPERVDEYVWLLREEAQIVLRAAVELGVADDHGL